MRVVLVAFAVSCAVVLAALPLRREGSRTATDAYIPLRALTPAEAALLLRAERAVLVGMDASSLELATRGYVASGHIHAATWKSYCSLYRLRRSELEAALGRRVDPAELRPLPDPVSFSPDRIVAYAVIEIAFLTWWLSAAAFVLRRIRHASAVLAALYPFLLVPMFFVLLYSPAFADADLFHQRIVVEALAVPAGVAAHWLLWPAALSLVVWLLRRYGSGIERARQILRARLFGSS